MFKTHLALGFLIALLSLQLFHPSFPWLFVPLAALFSGLPDVDTEKSKFGRKIYPLSLLFRVVFGHRGFFHSILAALGFYFLFVYLNLPFLALTMLVGYFAHLLGDAVTLEGVNFLWPFSGFRVSGFMRTGSVMESVVLGFLLAGNIFLILKMLNLF